MKVRIDMYGLRYGRLVGIAFAHRSANGHAHWLFQCDCGRQIVAAGGNVRSGSTSSCGCLHRELSAARLTEHGYRAAKHHGPTYRAWQKMRYEAGAEICARWADFGAFVADLGERPDHTRLGRRDVSKPFSSANCWWEPLESRNIRAKRAWARRRAAVSSPAMQIHYSSTHRPIPGATRPQAT